VAAPSAGDGQSLRVGEASIGRGSAHGSLEGIEWELRFSSDEAPLRHLPADWMYRAPLPKTKLTSPAPAARFDGSLSLNGRAHELGMRERDHGMTIEPFSDG